MISDQEIKKSKETIEKVNIDGYKKIYNKYIEEQPKQNKINKIYKLSFASFFIIVLITGLSIILPNTIINKKSYHIYGEKAEPSKPMREEEDALKSGGLHVIIPYLMPNIRCLEQAIGRSGI